MILVFGLLFANTFYWNRIALLAIGRPDFPVKVNFVLAVCKVTGILLLVPVFVRFRCLDDGGGLPIWAGQARAACRCMNRLVPTQSGGTAFPTLRVA